MAHDPSRPPSGPARRPPEPAPVQQAAFGFAATPPDKTATAAAIPATVSPPAAAVPAPAPPVQVAAAPPVHDVAEAPAAPLAGAKVKAVASPPRAMTVMPNPNIAIPNHYNPVIAQASEPRPALSVAPRSGTMAPGIGQSSRPRAGEPATEFLRIDAAKVAALMDLANELGLACSGVTRHEDVLRSKFQGFSAASHKLELLVRSIQTDLSALRLVAVSPAFQRMRRVLRDAARRTGKEVELVLQGEDTEMDKVMLDSLHDPLVHILRNAVDHGIESPQERLAAGKPAHGTVTISALQQGGEVTIEVKDDGRGLNYERILARARERKLCPADVTPSEEEIGMFIMAPGFSTKEAVDELSGRGVGMDVVKTTVEGLRGRLGVRSTAGHGSLIRMTLPLTLAFVEAMVVRKDNRLLALPIEKVFEVSKMDVSRVLPNATNGQTLIRVQDSCVPVLWLHDFWGEGESNTKLDGRVVVVVQTSRGPLALPVDEIIGNQQVMLKPLRGLLEGIRAAAGCGMLRTGDIAVALDCEQLVAA